MKRTYNFWKRAVAVLTSTALAVTMCVPALAWGSSNGAAESAQIITCNVSVKAKNFGNGEASSATTLSGVTLNDGWLTATNIAAYNGQLATWASVVATAAYKDDTTVTVTSRTIGSGTSTAAPAKGHSWGEWAVTTAPTCEAEGVQSRTCSACGASEEQTLPATAHSWSAWTTIVAATFLTSGTEERSCSACGATEQRAIAQLEEKKGAEFAQGNADYVISSAKSQTVSYAAPATSKAKKSAVLTVPLSVKVGNKRYAVRGIEPKAFAGTKATKLVIEAKGLSKKSLRNCLKGSKIQRVVVRAYKSTKKNEDYALLLKKYLTKAVCGKTVKVVAA